MTLFACDLDNTLLVSRRERRGGDICAERLDGREQSFITPKTREALLKLREREDIVFLPVTSRSDEQYRRIELPFQPGYALICNGTVLLQNGVPDEEWEAYYSGIIKKHLPEARMLLERYGETECFTSARLVDGRFFFAACTDEAAAREMHAKITEETGLEIMLSGRKLYRFPEGTDKGSAVKRLREIGGFSSVIAAGDSGIDLPMLNAADIAIAPDEKLAAGIARSVRAYTGGEGERFSEFVMGVVADLLNDK